MVAEIDGLNKSSSLSSSPDHNEKALIVLATHIHNTPSGVNDTALPKRSPRNARILTTEQVIARLGGRTKAESIVEALIEALDASDPDPDLEATNEDGGDIVDEPHDEELEDDSCDLEPSLGSINSYSSGWSQDGWAHGGRSDLEEQCEDEGACIQSHCHDAEDQEASLGSLDTRLDQPAWAREGGFHNEDEEAGAFDDEHCGRILPRTEAEVKNHVLHPVARRKRIASTERPGEVAQAVSRQLVDRRFKRSSSFVPYLLADGIMVIGEVG